MAPKRGTYVANLISFFQTTHALSRAGLDEAKDINMHLNALRWVIDYLEEGEFADYGTLIVPLLDTICRIWASSDHYSVPSKLTVLLQEISNLLIKQVRPSD